MPEEDFVSEEEMLFQIRKAVDKAAEDVRQQTNAAIEQERHWQDAASAERVRLIVTLIHAALVDSIGNSRTDGLLHRFQEAVEKGQPEPDRVRDDSTQLRVLQARDEVQNAVASLLGDPGSGA